MSSHLESVLVGDSAFIAAMALAVKERSGYAPRVAADPRQAFAWCAERGGLLVLKYGGPEWIPVVRDLRSLCGRAISVVVAVEPERMAEVAGLQHAGADEVIAWEGEAAPVAWAIERSLASREEGMDEPRREEPLAEVPPMAEPPARPLPSAPAPLAGPERAMDEPPVLPRNPVLPAGARQVPERAPPPAPRAGARLPAAQTPTAFTIREAAAAPGQTAEVAPAWPAAVPSGAEAEALLLAVATGTGGNLPGRDLAERVLHGLVVDPALPVDAALLRRASSLRLRVALALQTAPAPGAAIDTAAVQSLLAELDGELAALKEAGTAAGPDHQPGLDALRKALVSEAIDLTDAVHRIAPSQAPAVPPPAALREPRARVISNRAGVAEDERPPVKRGWLVLLALAALGAAAFHGYRYWSSLQAPPRQAPTFPGAPPGTVGLADPRSTLRLFATPDGKPLDAGQLEELKTREQLRGRTVKEVGPGAYLMVPDEQRPLEVVP